MNLYEEKIKTLALIEELNPDSDLLTDDPDIAAKINGSFNRVMFGLARFKKIPKYIEMEVSEGDIVTFEALERECGYAVYQIESTGGVRCLLKAGGTVIKVLESGTIEIEVFVYPERIEENTKDKAYEFELSDDALEILPYGVAADLLANDPSANFGNVYRTKYEAELQRLDPRYHMSYAYVNGGVNI